MMVMANLKSILCLLYTSLCTILRRHLAAPVGPWSFSVRFLISHIAVVFFPGLLNVADTWSERNMTLYDNPSRVSARRNPIHLRSNKKTLDLVRYNWRDIPIHYRFDKSCLPSGLCTYAASRSDLGIATHSSTCCETCSYAMSRGLPAIRKHIVH
jgi:hypothetical protein